MKTTITQIKNEMRTRGSHWWSNETMKFFGTRVESKVFEGKGGIFFVTSENVPFPPNSRERKSHVRKYNPQLDTIERVGPILEMEVEEAITLEEKFARGDVDQ